MNPRPMCLTPRCKRPTAARNDLRDMVTQIVADMRAGKLTLELAASKLLCVLLCFDRCQRCVGKIVGTVPREGANDPALGFDPMVDSALQPARVVPTPEPEND